MITYYSYPTPQQVYPQNDYNEPVPGWGAAPIIAGPARVAVGAVERSRRHRVPRVTYYSYPTPHQVYPQNDYNEPVPGWGAAPIIAGPARVGVGAAAATTTATYETPTATQVTTSPIPAPQELPPEEEAPPPAAAPGLSWTPILLGTAVAALAIGASLYFRRKKR